MIKKYTIKINFRGGIISPGDLYNILVAAGKANIHGVKFGLRQQLLADADLTSANLFTSELDKLLIRYECNKDEYPNIVSSYPAEEVFITNTWISEGVYKDIFDLMDYQPRLKINVSDSNQSFTPLFTGNINWVASPSSQHFWHLFIRFPKTNIIFEWKDLIYTNDVARLSRRLETLILENAHHWKQKTNANLQFLYDLTADENYISKAPESKLKLAGFNLPYYEGFNRYNDKYWLGIYRRDELFRTEFLRDLCLLCLETRVGQICSTPWKSLIVKGIEEKDRVQWSRLLAKYQVNVRHAANELNFQVEDNCNDGLALKNFLVKRLDNDDLRTFGICVGIKTRRKSEVFSSILVRRRPLLRIGKLELLHVYDILCSKDFDPNERTGFIYSEGNPKFVLYEQLRRAILAYYNHHAKKHAPGARVKKERTDRAEKPVYVHQCPHCLTVYDPVAGDPENNIPPGTDFEQLQDNYTCALCEAPINEFTRVAKSSLGLETV
jgi:rubredoxin